MADIQRGLVLFRYDVSSENDGRLLKAVLVPCQVRMWRSTVARLHAPNRRRWYTNPNYPMASRVTNISRIGIVSLLSQLLFT